MAHKGWYSRGYLPHFDNPGLIQGVTLRLWDSIPAVVIQTILADTEDGAERRARLEEYLNAGHGACYLRDPRVARLVEDALLHFDGERYRLIAWVIMPNHVHVLLEVFPGFPLPEVVHSWKSYTANRANRLLNRTGSFWFREYFDRFIRDERHLANALRYVHENPVTAGLVKTAGDWEFSSARRWNVDDM